MTSRAAPRSRSARIARATSRFTRACVIAISRRPRSQIGSETVSVTDCTSRALGKNFESKVKFPPASVRVGRYCPRVPRSCAAACRSFARATRYCGPCRRASLTAAGKVTGSSGGGTLSG